MAEDSALLVIDVFNHYEHPEGERLADSAQQALQSIRYLVERARAAGTVVVFVNDDHGLDDPTPQRIIERAMSGARPDLIRQLDSVGDAEFIVKARHSGFHDTELHELLQSRGVERLVLCGQVTEQCVLHTAFDAHARRYDLAVATDALAQIEPELARASLRMMEENMNAELAPAAKIGL